MDYQIKKVLEAAYTPADGEPFCVAWGAEGWMIWCRIPIETPGGETESLAPVTIKIKPELTAQEKRVAGLAKAREAKRLKRAKHGKD